MTRTEGIGDRALAGGGVLLQQAVGPQENVLLLTIDNPPLNALTAPIRAEIAATLTQESERGPGARPVVLTGAGGIFSAATLVEAGEAVTGGAPSLGVLCEMIDAAVMPVVAAVSGRMVGPGAELALACHARILASGARVIFPEAGLGLSPMAGASQRLPRLTGAEEALSLLLQARPVAAEEALAIGLADHITEGDPVPAAIKAALAMKAPRPVTARTDGLEDVAAYGAAIAAARNEQARNPMPAPARIIDCIEAALYLPPENGFALEAVIFEDLLASAESQGLLASARAERAANITPAEIARLRPAEIRILGLSGAGPQLAALALLALGRGLRVIWAAPENEGDGAAHDRITAWIRERLEAETRSGRLSAAQRDSDLLRLQTHQPVSALAEAELVIHGKASAGTAGDVIERISRAAPSIPQLVIGGARGRAGVSIAPSGRVCEISTGGVLSPQALAASWRLMRSFGLQPVLSGGLPQIGRQVAAVGQAALVAMLGMGVPRRLISSVLTGFGQTVPDLPDPPLDVAARGMAAEEVLNRWLGAMANEGYRLIAESVAPGGSSVDFLMVQGHAFPRWRGGPMHQAARRGAMVLRSDLKRWQEDDPLWSPHPILDRLVSRGRGRAAA